MLGSGLVSSSCHAPGRLCCPTVRIQVALGPKAQLLSAFCEGTPHSPSHSQSCRNTPSCLWDTEPASPTNRAASGAHPAGILQDIDIPHNPPFPDLQDRFKTL